MDPSCTELLEVAPDRRAAILRLATELRPGRKVALSTHVNADGDGCGSEVALVRLLGQMGLDAWIVNPTPWPTMFEFLCGDGVRDESSKGVPALARADVLLVVDISDLKRLGVLGEPARALPAARLVIDHHIPSEEAAGDFLFVDTTACATGELVFDLATVLGLTITEPVARALYAAILTDTGGFRFSNTTPRCHAIAAHLLAAGVDPEEMYRRIYASVPLGRMQLLRDALATLEVDSELGIAWISVMADSMDKYGLKTEDLDGIVEHPRSIAGTRLALFFRDLGYGKVKVSFRSTGDVDVNDFARRFGGGGHAKASGALIAGSLDDVRPRVIAAAKEYVRSLP